MLGDKPAKLPAIVYDGIVDESKVKDGVVPPEATPSDLALPMRSTPALMKVEPL